MKSTHHMPITWLLAVACALGGCRSQNPAYWDRHEMYYSHTYSDDLNRFWLEDGTTIDTFTQDDYWLHTRSVPHGDTNTDFTDAMKSLQLLYILSTQLAANVGSMSIDHEDALHIYFEFPDKLISDRPIFIEIEDNQGSRSFHPLPQTRRENGLVVLEHVTPRPTDSSWPCVVLSFTCGYQSSADEGTDGPRPKRIGHPPPDQRINVWQLQNLVYCD